MAKANFEESLEKLESLVTDLESGKFTLDDSIKKFEEGIKLYKSCRTKLVDAEKKIKILTDSLEEEDYEQE